MFLTAKILKSVQNVNSFEVTTEWKMRQGNPTTIYFQLADGEQLNSKEEPLRYMPEAGATVSATFSSIVATNTVGKIATQPFPLDTSIWAININATDKIAQGNFTFTLTEGAVVRTASVASAIVVESTNPSFC